MKRTIVTVPMVGLITTLALLAVSGWLFDRNIRRMAEADRWVDHTQQVLLELDGLLLTVQEAESAQRGFVITQDELYLKLFRQDADRVQQYFGRLHALTADNVGQQTRIAELEQRILAKLDSLDSVVALVKESGSEAGQGKIRQGHGAQQMDAVRLTFGELRQEEQRLLRQRADESAASNAQAVLSNALGVVTTMALVLAVFFLISRYTLLQQQAATALRTERERLRVTLASIGDAVVATDATGRVTFLNSVAEQLTGWRDHEAEGRPLKDVFHIVNETTRQRMETPCDRVLREGTVVGLANHTVLIARDGSERPIDDSGAPIRDETGNVHGVVLVFRDATELRRSVEAKERLAAIVEDSNDAIIGHDLDGVIITWNKGAEHLFGYTAEEAVGKSIEVIIPPDRRSEFSDSIERLKRGERAAHIDTVRVRKDGTRVDVASHISPLRNAEGEVIGASKLSHDISQRKRHEETLKFLADASTTLAALVDYESTMQRVARLVVPYFADWCLVDMVDSNGQIQRVAYAHYDPDQQAVLKDFVERFPPDWNSSALSVQVLRSGKLQLITAFSEVMLDRLANNAEHRALIESLAPQSCIGVPIVIRSQTVGSLVFVLSRPSRRYTATDLDLALELSKRAGIAIENARLYRDVKEAQRQKDDFLAMLAHELRNPLAAIQYANEVAKMTGNEDGKAIDVIDRQVKTLAHLVDDLLDVSRITRDKIQLQKEHADGGVLLRRAIGTARPGIDERRHSLVVEVTDEPLPLLVDPVRIEQILVNLLSNATKYTPEGGKITARAFAQDEQIVFSVRDTGVGIPKEMLPRVFELFTQVDRSLDRSQGGLGIGLTVVRRLAEMHGGSVSATSEGLGRGSEFTVRFPRAAPAEVKPHHAATPEARGRHLKVLVVEDNADTAKSLVLLLELAGHKTAVAHDGKTAIVTARAFVPDVILMDLGLPGIDGYHVAETLRRENGFHEVQMIAISGYGQAGDRRRSREAGFDAHLVKPVNFKDLSALLSTIATET